MTSSTPVPGSAGARVTVEFAASAAGEAAVTGQVLDEHGQAVPFTGWIGLLEVLEALAAPLTHPTPARHEVTP